MTFPSKGRRQADGDPGALPPGSYPVRMSVACVMLEPTAPMYAAGFRWAAVNITTNGWAVYTMTAEEAQRAGVALAGLLDGAVPDDAPGLHG